MVETQISVDRWVTKKLFQLVCIIILVPDNYVTVKEWILQNPNEII